MVTDQQKQVNSLKKVVKKKVSGKIDQKIKRRHE